MDQLLGAMAIFIQYPALAAGIGLVLLGLARRAHSRVAVGAGVAWLLYGLYEFAMKQHWLCSGECNIRIDLSCSSIPCSCSAWSRRGSVCSERPRGRARPLESRVARDGPLVQAKLDAPVLVSPYEQC